MSLIFEKTATTHFYTIFAYVVFFILQSSYRCSLLSVVVAVGLLAVVYILLLFGSGLIFQTVICKELLKLFAVVFVC